jgi:FAD binding domain
MLPEHTLLAALRAHPKVTVVYDVLSAIDCSNMWSSKACGLLRVRSTAARTVAEAARSHAPAVQILSFRSTHSGSRGAAAAVVSSAQSTSTTRNGSAWAGAAAACVGAGLLLSQQEQTATCAASKEPVVPATSTITPAPVSSVSAPYDPVLLVDRFKGIVGPANVSVDDDDREAHGKPYNSYHKVDRSPDVVVSPRTTEEVSAIVKLCAAHKVPIVPYGGATSLEGHLLAPEVQLTISYAHTSVFVYKHCYVLEYSMQCVVQAAEYGMQTYKSIRLALNCF